MQIRRTKAREKRRRMRENRRKRKENRILSMSNTTFSSWIKYLMKILPRNIPLWASGRNPPASFKTSMASTQSPTTKITADLDIPYSLDRHRLLYNKSPTNQLGFLIQFVMKLLCFETYSRAIYFLLICFEKLAGRLGFRLFILVCFSIFRLWAFDALLSLEFFIRLSCLTSFRVP